MPPFVLNTFVFAWKQVGLGERMLQPLPGLFLKEGPGWPGDTIGRDSYTSASPEVYAKGMRYPIKRTVTGGELALSRHRERRPTAAIPTTSRVYHGAGQIEERGPAVTSPVG